MTPLALLRSPGRKRSPDRRSSVSGRWPPTLVPRTATRSGRNCHARNGTDEHGGHWSPASGRVCACRSERGAVGQAPDPWTNMLMMLSQVRIKPTERRQPEVLQHGRIRQDDADAKEAKYRRNCGGRGNDPSLLLQKVYFLISNVEVVPRKWGEPWLTLSSMRYNAVQSLRRRAVQPSMQKHGLRSAVEE